MNSLRRGVAVQRILSHLHKIVTERQKQKNPIEAKGAEHWLEHGQGHTHTHMHRPLRDQQREPIMTDSSYGRRATASTRSMGVEPTTVVSTVHTSALGHTLSDAGLLELADANALDFVYNIRQFAFELSSDSTICTQGHLHQL